MTAKESLLDQQMLTFARLQPVEALGSMQSLFQIYRDAAARRGLGELGELFNDLLVFTAEAADERAEIGSRLSSALIPVKMISEPDDNSSEPPITFDSPITSPDDPRLAPHLANRDDQ